jgi:hypothetical protein
MMRAREVIINRDDLAWFGKFRVIEMAEHPDEIFTQKTGPSGDEDSFSFESPRFASERLRDPCEVLFNNDL